MTSLPTFRNAATCATDLLELRGVNQLAAVGEDAGAKLYDDARGGFEGVAMHAAKIENSNRAENVKVTRFRVTLPSRHHGSHRPTAARGPIVAVKLPEDFSATISASTTIAQVVRDGAVLAPEIQIHLGRETGQRVGGGDGEQPAIGIIAAIKLGVAGQNLRRVETGIERDGKHFPVRRRVGIGGQKFPRLSEIFYSCAEQNSGSGQLVKKNVKATAHLRKSENFTNCPVSLVNS